MEKWKVFLFLFLVLLKYQKEVIIYLKLMKLLKIYLKAKIKSLEKLITKLIKKFLGRQSPFHL